MLKNLVFIIKPTHNYLRTTDDFISQNKVLYNLLFESISDLYIPLLEMLEGLEKDNIKARIGIVLPPVLCNLLSNETVKNMYVQWLEDRIELGKREQNRCKENNEFIKIINETIEQNLRLKDAFENKYSKSILEKYAEYQSKGYLEILATCGTEVFVPHFMDIPEVISAQIETGLQSYRNYFGELPDGFWLPKMAYFPGVESLIKAYGYTYTVLDSKSILLSDKVPSSGVFYPSRTGNLLALFAADSQFEEYLYAEEEGIATNSVYRNEKRDIGFELPESELSPILSDGDVRFSTGYCYWNRSFNNPESIIYSKDKAYNQIQTDASNFLVKKNELLSKAAELLEEKKYVTSVCVIDCEKLQKNWHEGLWWLEEVIRQSEKYSLNVTTCNMMIEKNFNLERIEPYYSSAAGDGYGENFLSSKNCWMIRHIRKACERMVDLADRFPNDTGLKNRLLNMGAKELLLAQSCNLQKMIDEDEFADYAEERFRASISAFTAVFDSLGSNTVSTEWLTKLEVLDDIFPWMNYRIFSKKQ